MSMSQEVLSKGRHRIPTHSATVTPRPTLGSRVGPFEHLAIGRVCFISGGKGESQRFQLRLTFGDFCKEFSTSRHTSSLSR